MDDSKLELVQRLKDYAARIYQLTPPELIDFIKIKGNLLQCGIALSDDLLSASEDVILTRMESTSITGICPSLDDLLSANVESMEQERVAIRKQLFGNAVTVKVLQAGTSFTVHWNKKLTACKVTIPSSWNITVDHGLLMNQYDMLSGKTPQRDITSEAINESEENVLELFSMYQDYAIVKYVLKDTLSNVDLKTYLIETLRKAVTMGRISIGSVLSWVGPHRKRLIVMLASGS